jgi:hypothetical protein
MEHTPTFEEKCAWIDANRTPEVLQHLQFYGTEYRRKQSPHYWVNRMSQRLKEDAPQIALISDMRFKNEFMWTKSVGGYTVKVTRYGYVLDDGRDPKHISEVDLDSAPFDFEISVLDGEVDQLKRDAVTVFELIESLVNPIPQEVSDGQFPLAA